MSWTAAGESSSWVSSKIKDKVRIHSLSGIYWFAWCLNDSWLNQYTDQPDIIRNHRAATSYSDRKTQAKTAIGAYFSSVIGPWRVVVIAAWFGTSGVGSITWKFSFRKLPLKPLNTFCGKFGEQPQLCLFTICNFVVSVSILSIQA